MQLSRLVQCLSAVAVSASGLAHAAPVITGVSGNVGQDQTITIAGSGFGTKSRAAPVVFDDFESGTVGARIENRAATVGSWTSGDWSYAVSYGNTSPLEGSKVARHAFNATDYNASLYYNPSATQTLYMDFWMRAVPKSAGLTRNWKPWRLYNASDADVANDVVFCNGPGWVGLASGGGAWVQRERNWSQWEHFQVVVRLGSGGVFAQYRDGYTDALVNNVSSSQSITQVRIGHYWAADSDQNCGSNPGADVYSDLVYVDTSLARVVIGDASTLAASRNTAIVVPSAWSANQVTGRVKTARFASGASAYLFVVDGNNAASPGFPVTIGQGQTAPPPPTTPNAPTALTAN